MISQSSQSIPEFIQKLHRMMLQHPQTINFSTDGSEVIINDHTHFIESLLPTFFRHNKWRSFIRQMNMYGFKKINRGNSKYIFASDIFKEGNEHNFKHMRRKGNLQAQKQQGDQRNIDSQVNNCLVAECLGLGIDNNVGLFSHGYRGAKAKQYSHENNINTHTNTNTMASFSQKKNRSSNISSLQNLSVLNFMNANVNVGMNMGMHMGMNMYPSSNSSAPSSSSSLNPPSGYSNSVVHFLSILMEMRQKMQKIGIQIKGNLQGLGKQKKNVEGKQTISQCMETVKLVEEISGKFKRSMEIYVESRENKENNSQQKQTEQNEHFKVFETAQMYPLMQTQMMTNLGANFMGNSIFGQKNMAPMNLNNINNMNNVNVIASCNQINPINLIIPQPIVSVGVVDQLQRKNSLQKQLQEQANRKMMQGDHHQYKNESICCNPEIKNNQLGVSSLCSFSSVTHLLNFDKE